MQTAERFSQVATPICTPSAVDGTRLAPCLYQLLVNHFCLHFGHLRGLCSRHLMVVLFCISLVTREVGHLFIC